MFSYLCIVKNRKKKIDFLLFVYSSSSRKDVNFAYDPCTANKQINTLCKLTLQFEATQCFLPIDTSKICALK